MSSEDTWQIILEALDMAEESSGTRTGSGPMGAGGAEVERRGIEGDEGTTSTTRPSVEAGGDAGTTMDGLSEKARERTERWSEAASRRVVSLMHAFHAAEHALREDGEGTMADWAASAAQGVERMSDYLEHEDADALMGDAQRVARDHPVTFLGGSFAAGIAAGRFLRASRGTSSEGDGLSHGGEWSESWREGSERWESGGASAAGLPHGQPSGFTSPAQGESHVEEAKP